MSFLKGNSEVLRTPCRADVCAKGLSVRDLQDAFRDATGELLIFKICAVGDHRLPFSRTLKAFSPRDLSEITVE